MPLGSDTARAAIIKVLLVVTTSLQDFWLPQFQGLCRVCDVGGLQHVLYIVLDKLYKKMSGKISDSV